MKIFSTLKQLWKDTPRIEIFMRHCHFSSASAHKARFEGFDKKHCFENLIETIDKPNVNLTCFLDTHFPAQQRHFLLDQTKFPVINIDEGTEAGSFLNMLAHVASLSLPDETIVYFLEDDYLHRKGWVDVLCEGLSIPGIDYVTLFDHRDKYCLKTYPHLESKIYQTASCHWRTTPSTTNTHAMRYKTLIRDLEIHREFSLNRKITADHEKFTKLKERGALLISSLPGWSTHLEPAFASPCYDWENELMVKKPTS